MKIKIPDLIKKTNPRWTKKLLERKTFSELQETCVIDGKALQIGKYSSCIVGETLDLFDVDYDDFARNGSYLTVDRIHTEYHKGCKVCSDFSMEFHRLIAHNEDIEELEVELELYAEHLEMKHKNLVEKANAKN